MREISIWAIIHIYIIFFFTKVPFIFSGTIRRNLDPLNEFNDEEIFSALRETNLLERVRNL